MVLRSNFKCCVAVCVGIAASLLCCSVSDDALASPPAVLPLPAPAWHVTNVAFPSTLQPTIGKTGVSDVLVENVGGADSQGPITVKDLLPAGFSVSRIEAEPALEEPECPTASGREVVCNFYGEVVPSGFMVLVVYFEVTENVGALTSTVEVNGGGAPAITNESSIKQGSEHETRSAGITQFNLEATGPDGEPFRQAGGHPHFLTTSLVLNTLNVENLVEPRKPVEPTKDLVFYLPLGMLGDPAVTDTCPASLVQIQGELSGCPPASRVGTILPLIASTVFADTKDSTHVHGLYSMTTEKGYAAEFAFGADGLTFFVYASVVRHDGKYMLRVATPGLPGVASLAGLVATFYGDIVESYSAGNKELSADRGAFLTDPSDCQASSEARTATVEMDSWKNPNVMLKESALTFSALEGCEELEFSSTLSVKPESTQADEPSGYEIGLGFPQAPNGGAGLATPPLKNAKITLPAGTTISPSAANGILACQEVGPSGINVEGSESEAIGEDGLEHLVAGHCPHASELGEVQASTPLLKEALNGHLFLAAPHCGGGGQRECAESDAENGELYSLYLELEAPKAGVIIKLRGKASVSPSTGQIKAEFDENPQFPLNSLTVSMTGGARAPLANPQDCGVASTQGRLTSWAEPYTPEVTPSDFFRVDWNGAGEACPATAPFSPSFAAGTTSPLAAGTSPFTLTLKREDREQNVESLSSTLPEGLLANVSKVGRCSEPQASQASLSACPANSQIGTTTVAVGSGTDPYYVTGKVFFTGPYGGAPFGLSVVVPAVAGPFNLGNVLVRVALFIDPHTAQVTAVSNPLPQILDGVPLRMRTLNVTLDAHEFALNPTSCSQLKISGAVYSTTGATASVSSPFAAAGCKNLPFKPVLSASTDAKSTKANGTGVKVKIAYPASGEANVAKVVIGFPKQLPVRLSTLQQACRAAIFEANPAACPSGSNIGSAEAHTPILNQPLVGPAYLVSYGSTKFPDVVFVLQGEGVTLDVDGQSFVSQAGALKVTFAAVPDAPFSTFETVLPAGRYSQFTATKSTAQAEVSQCGENLVAPVTMVGHNGAEVTQNAKFQITGCKPKVLLVEAKARAGGLVVTVKTSSRGRLKISGEGLKTVVKSDVGAGVHKLTLAFTSAGRRASRAHKKVQVTVGLVVGKQKVSKHQNVTL